MDVWIIRTPIWNIHRLAEEFLPQADHNSSREWNEPDTSTFSFVRPFYYQNPHCFLRNCHVLPKKIHNFKASHSIAFVLMVFMIGAWKGHHVETNHLLVGFRQTLVLQCEKMWQDPPSQKKNKAAEELCGFEYLENARCITINHWHKTS